LQYYSEKTQGQREAMTDLLPRQRVDLPNSKLVVPFADSRAT